MDGIQIIEVGGHSDAVFTLAAPVIAGIYDYNLYQADGQNWYLQSHEIEPPSCTPGVDCPVIEPPPPIECTPGFDCAVDPPEPPPECAEAAECPIDPPPPPPPPSGKKVADSIKGYNVALAATDQHIRATLETLHERVGELRTLSDQESFDTWARAIGRSGSYRADTLGYGHEHRYTLASGGLQLGADYTAQGLARADDALTFGLFGDYVSSHASVSSTTASIAIQSAGVGAYATYQAHAPRGDDAGRGLYVDAMVKADRLHTDVMAKSVSGFDIGHGYAGRAYTASLEAGYAITAGHGFAVIPQIQLTHTRIGYDNFTDATGVQVADQRGDSLRGRLGVRVEKQHARQDGRPAFTTFVDANMQRALRGDNTLQAADTALGTRTRGTTFELGVGAAGQLSKHISLYGRVGVAAGGATRLEANASGGLKVSW